MIQRGEKLHGGARTRQTAIRSTARAVRPNIVLFLRLDPRFDTANALVSQKDLQESLRAQCNIGIMESVFSDSETLLDILNAREDNSIAHLSILTHGEIDSIQVGKTESMHMFGSTCETMIKLLKRKLIKNASILLCSCNTGKIEPWGINMVTPPFYTLPSIFNGLKRSKGLEKFRQKNKQNIERAVKEMTLRSDDKYHEKPFHLLTFKNWCYPNFACMLAMRLLGHSIFCTPNTQQRGELVVTYSKDCSVLEVPVIYLSNQQSMFRYINEDGRGEPHCRFHEAEPKTLETLTGGGNVASVKKLIRKHEEKTKRFCNKTRKAVNNYIRHNRLKGGSLHPLRAAMLDFLKKKAKTLLGKYKYDAGSVNKVFREWMKEDKNIPNMDKLNALQTAFKNHVKESSETITNETKKENECPYCQEACAERVIQQNQSWRHKYDGHLVTIKNISGSKRTYNKWKLKWGVSDRATVHFIPSDGGARTKMPLKIFCSNYELDPSTNSITIDCVTCSAKFHLKCACKNYGMKTITGQSMAEMNANPEESTLAWGRSLGDTEYTNANKRNCPVCRSYVPEIEERCTRAKYYDKRMFTITKQWGLDGYPNNTILELEGELPPLRFMAAAFGNVKDLQILYQDLLKWITKQSLIPVPSIRPPTMARGRVHGGARTRQTARRSTSGMKRKRLRLPTDVPPFDTNQTVTSTFKMWVPFGPRISFLDPWLDEQTIKKINDKWHFLQDRGGRTLSGSLLHWAIHGNQQENIEFGVFYKKRNYFPTKVGINLRDDDGNTALHLLAKATMSNGVKQKIIDYILDKRRNDINLSLENDVGQTAADVFGGFSKRKLEMFNINKTKVKDIRKNSADMMLDPEQYMYIAHITKTL